jgi:hypothetical protein
MTAMGNGSYVSNNLQFTVADSYTLSIKLDGVTEILSPPSMPLTNRIKVVPSLVQAAHSVLVSPSSTLHHVTAGIPDTFTIQAKDIYQNVRMAGSDRMILELYGPSGLDTLQSTSGDVSEPGLTEASMQYGTNA